MGTHKAWLFRAGSYPDKGVEASASYLDTLAANSNGQPIPLDLEHGPTEGVLPFGEVLAGTLAVEQGTPPGGQSGTWLVGQVSVDPAIDSRLRHRGLSVLLDTAARRIAKVAVTASPRVLDAQFSGPVVTLEGGVMSMIRFDDGGELPEPTDGWVTRLRARLGVGSKVEPEPEPAAEPPGESQPFADAVKAAVAEALSGQAAEHQARLAELSARAEQVAADGLLAFRQARLAEGCPPWAVDLLAPFACGQAKAEVAFSDGPREATAAEVCAEVLRRFAGAVPMGRLLPATDQRHVAFDDRVAERARVLVSEATASGSALSLATATDRALAEARAAKEG